MTSASFSYAWGQYLAQFDWSVVATLTSRPGTSRQQVVREFLRMIQCIGRQTAVRWVYVVETSPGGINHIHALLWFGANVPIKSLDSHWRLGHKSLRRYKPHLGAAFYLPKSLGRGLPDDYDISAELPPVLETATDVPSAALR
jgi:hypothetical protein